MGYAGGTTKDPSYQDLGDHSETVQIDFDPARITYRQLLDIFWKSHDPASSPWSRQYRAVIFYNSEAQRKLAIETRDHLASVSKKRILTAIEPYSGFHIAEDYHQKHSLRAFPEIMKEFKKIYPDMEDLVNSTAVARVNGYLGGYGSCDSLKKEINDLGLSIRAKEKLVSETCTHGRSITCPVH